MDMVEEGSVDIYNEFSLQHELGIFLREELSDYKVQFERNTKFFGIYGTIKHEIEKPTGRKNRRVKVLHSRY